MPEIIGASKNISGFDPRSIPGCLMWLEPTNFTGTGSSTVWADRSGNGYNMSYNASYTSPPVLNTTSKINGNNSVSFTGTSACRLTGTITFPNSERTIFIVLRPTGMTSSAGANISLFGPSSGGYLSMSLQPYTGTYPYYWFLTNTGNYQVMATQSGTFPTLNDVCMMAAVNAATAADNVLTLNGVTQALDNANNAASYSGGATTQFLGGGGGGTPGNWDCCEMIFYSYALSPSQRQQVEGYLAWKWGVRYTPQAASVPGIPPSVVSSNTPYGIPGCALWLDASDTSTIQYVTTPTAYFPFDSSIVDQCNAITLTRTGSVPFVVGKYGQAVSFSNAQGSLSSNYLSSTYALPSTFTASMWFQTPTPSPSVASTIFYTNSNPTYVLGGAVIYFAGGNLYCAYSSVANNGTGYAISANTWYHVAITYNSGSLTLYVNGVQSGSVVTGTNSKNGFTLGGSADNPGTTYYPFTGYLDDLRIFSNVLTSTDISNIYIGSINQWSDKSGMLNHAIRGTRGTYPTITSSNTVLFSNTSSAVQYFNTRDGQQTTQSITYVMVLKIFSHSTAVMLDQRKDATGQPTHLVTPDVLLARPAGTNTSVNVNITLPQNSTIVLTYQSTLNTMNGYVNGVSIGTSSAALSLPASDSWHTTIGALSDKDTLANQLTYSIGVFEFSEFMMFNAYLTTTQRQQIEGYLGSKWRVAVPSRTPIIDGLSMWLDGADPNGNGTTPSNGATVSTWVDKSGNSRNATVASGRIGGTWSTASNTVYFQASNVGYVTSYPANPTNETMFIVANINSPANVNNNTIIGGQAGARSFGFGYSGAPSSGSGYSSYLNNEVAWSSTSVRGPPTGTTALITGTVSGTTSLSVSKNGETAVTGSITAWTGGTTTYLGVDTTNASYYFIGYVMEIIFYNSVLTTTQRRQIESYLITKWGIGAYAINYTPLLNSPLNIPSCCLWLDATDRSTINSGTITVGSSVTTWSDKSGQGNTAVASNSPVWSLNAINGNNAMYLGNSAAIGSTPGGTNASGIAFRGTLSTAITGTTLTVFAIATWSGYQVSRDQRIVSLASNTATPDYGSASGVAVFDVQGATCNLITYRNFTTIGSNDTMLVGSPTLCTTVYNGANGYLWLNGRPATSTGTASTGNFASTVYGIGCDAHTTTNGENWYGYIGEVIIFSNALNDVQRSTVERYLSLKWGLSNFYTSIPGSVPGLMLWLDGADTSTITFQSGSNVNGWKDKATLGITLSNSCNSGYPTYVAGKGIYCSNTSSSAASNSQALGRIANWPSAIPSQNVTVIMSYQNFCNDNYRAPFYISMFETGTLPLSNFFFGIGNGNSGYSCNQIQYDNTSGTSTWGGLVTSTTGTQQQTLGVRVDALISRPGVTSGWMYVNNVEMSYTQSNAYTSPYSNWLPNTIKIGGAGANQLCLMYAHEVLIYSNALDATQRSVVQSYLARKWNNTALPNDVLRPTHPFATVQPAVRAFALADIGVAPEYWFDASDASTIVANGTYMLMILNKGSTTDSNVTPEATGYITTGLSNYNGLNLINIPSTRRMQFTSIFPSAARARFIVTRQTSSGNIVYMFQGGSATSGNDYLAIESTTIMEVFQGNIGTMSGTVSSFSGTMTLITFFNSASSASSNRVAINGSNVSLSTNLTAQQFNASSITTYFGGTSGSGQDFGEFINFTRELTLPQIYQIEGYLSQKWGITLASTHPYSKSQVATAIPWLPTSITGCALWLDAADTSTMIISSGSNVMTWRDKSGSAYAAVSQGTPATIVTSSYGGNTSLLFNGSSTYYCPTSPFSNAGYTIFTVQHTTSTASFQRAINVDPYVYVGAVGGFVATFSGNGTSWNDTASNTPPYYNVNSNTIVCMQVSNAVLTPYVNGIVQTTKTGTTSSFSNFYIGSYSTSGVQGWYGNISEIIIYNGILSTPQRQQVEGYLAWKWGLVSSSSPADTKKLIFWADQSIGTSSSSLAVINTYLSLFINLLTFPFGLSDYSGTTLTLPYTGAYLIEISGWRCGAGTGQSRAIATRNGTTIYQRTRSGINQDCSIWTVQYYWNLFRAGDVLTLYKSDNTGGTTIGTTTSQNSASDDSRGPVKIWFVQ
jgi:hypothetical protein